MERLTVKRKDGRWAIANNDGASPMEQMEKIPIAINRLAAYEDTGLEPGEIAELKRGWKAVCKLHRINVPPPNDPLTLDELRDMGEEWVWIKFLIPAYGMESGYYIKKTQFSDADKFCCGYSAPNLAVGYLVYAGYGDMWVAYRRNPEEGTR